MTSKTSPGAWITEWDTLYVVASGINDFERMNRELAESDYRTTLSLPEYQNVRTDVWVEPSAVANEVWEEYDYSYEPVEGWTHLYEIDLNFLQNGDREQ